MTESIEKLTNELVHISPKKIWIDNILKQKKSANHLLYDVIGHDFVERYGYVIPAKTEPKFIPPNQIPSNMMDLSIKDWARWIYQHQPEWNYVGCKYPDKSREWVTAKDRHTGRDIDNQKLLRDHQWEELTENQLYLVRGTIEAFMRYLRSIGIK